MTALDAPEFPTHDGGETARAAPTFQEAKQPSPHPPPSYASGCLLPSALSLHKLTRVTFRRPTLTWARHVQAMRAQRAARRRRAGLCRRV
jgi:hypothetical protein